MKIVKKIFGILASFMLIGTLGLTSCSDSDNGGDDETPSSTITEVTVNFGEEKEIYIPGKTACEFDVPAPTGLTVKPVDGKPGYFKIVAADAESTYEGTVTAYFVNGDADDAYVTVTITVYNPNAILKMTFEESLNNVTTVTVHYGADDGTYEDVIAEASAEEPSVWTAKLDKDLGNKWLWYNKVFITAKDSNGDTVAIEYVDNFCYTNESSIIAINVKAAKATKEFTISFDGFNIAGGSVTGLKITTSKDIWVNDATDSNGNKVKVSEPDVTVNEQGTAATFTIDKANMLNGQNWFQINFANVELKSRTDETVTATSGYTNAEFDYATSDLTHTYKLVSGTEYNVKTGTVNIEGNSTYNNIVTASDFSGYTNISSISVSVAFTSDVAGSDNNGWWLCIGTDSSYVANAVWGEGNVYSCTLTDTASISSLVSNGLSVYGNIVDSDATVTVSVIAESDGSTAGSETAPTN